MRFSRRAVSAAAVVFGCAFAASAYGAKPQTFPVLDDHTVAVTDICAFPVSVTIHAEGRVRLYLDSTGNVTMIQAQIRETDTFSANGHTIVGLPYHLSDQLRFDANGNPTEKVTGLVERLRLPNGKMFISAGRLVPPPDSGGGFSIAPTVGHTGDVAALCAALAP